MAIKHSNTTHIWTMLNDGGFPHCPTYVLNMHAFIIQCIWIQYSDCFIREYISQVFLMHKCTLYILPIYYMCTIEYKLDSYIPS